ncbi:uncharacterized protein LOC130211637 [Pseudoliparis swirei]|uniref:uncharacterized protein LOC130211637 n=1 Tax=Pseudoliparis swirei TaxID=2059687 RepID=UPI0024BE2914|nr:uncharacterized protein LOC130211637 [Pseudoliparis swirei]
MLSDLCTFVHTVKRRRRGESAGASPPAWTSHTAARNIPLQRAFTGKQAGRTPATSWTSKQWTSEAVEDLQACLDCTDWEVFRTASDSLDESTEAVTSYISFCEDSCVPSRTRVSYNNDKPWFTVKLKKLRLEKEEAFRSGNRDGYVEAKYRFRKEVRDAKREYSKKLEHQLSANDSASVWKGLRLITNCKPRTSHSTNDSRLANSLNEFYCRFDGQWSSPDTFPRDTSLQPQPINCPPPSTVTTLHP